MPASHGHRKGAQGGGLAVPGGGWAQGGAHPSKATGADVSNPPPGWRVLCKGEDRRGGGVGHVAGSRGFQQCQEDALRVLGWQGRRAQDGMTPISPSCTRGALLTAPPTTEGVSTPPARSYVTSTAGTKPIHFTGKGEPFRYMRSRICERPKALRSTPIV